MDIGWAFAEEGDIAFSLWYELGCCGWLFWWWKEAEKEPRIVICIGERESRVVYQRIVVSLCLRVSCV